MMEMNRSELTMKNIQSQIEENAVAATVLEDAGIMPEVAKRLRESNETLRSLFGELETARGMLDAIRTELKPPSEWPLHLAARAAKIAADADSARMTRVLQEARNEWAQKVALEIELREALGGKWPVATSDKVRQIKIAINGDAPPAPYEERVTQD
jgi:hypothetical protein